jgi:ribonuclease BN (tRNA processing enzyme)
VFGPPGLRAFLAKLAAAFGDYASNPGFPLEVVELSAGRTWSDPGGRLALTCHPTPHTDASVAYRVDHAGDAVGYTGDTGPSDALADFFAELPLLVAECSLEDPLSMDTHLSPRTLAALAGRARPGLLVVTHLYPPLRPHRLSGLLRAAGYGGPVVVARDGTRILVRDGQALLQDG